MNDYIYYEPLPEDWLIEFDDLVSGALRMGAPFGLNTAMADRAMANKNPWDKDCAVEVMVGGETTMQHISDAFKIAIQEANASNLPFSDPRRGHVYIAGMRLNPNRILDSDGNNAWTLIKQMMDAGIRVRILLFMPDFGAKSANMLPHQCAHLYLANLVKVHNKNLKIIHNVDDDIGVVFLDLRLPRFLGVNVWSVGSHHQKFIVIRGNVTNYAFCGGVDLAYTRRDSPVFEGDEQSGDEIPYHDITTDYIYDNGNLVIPPCNQENKKFKQGSDLPKEVYGTNRQIWLDHHLKLQGPIVSTLEEIFVQRWEDWGYTEEIPITDLYIKNGIVISSSSGALTGNKDSPIKPLKDIIGPIIPVDEIIGTEESKTYIQPWQTIPFRRDRKGKEKDNGFYPYYDGEFSFMSGLVKACKQAKDLILIFDQYFWNVPYARFLAEQLLRDDKENLHLIIFLPPFSDLGNTTTGIRQHYFRNKAISVLPFETNRVKVYSMWNNIGGHDISLQNRGIYCHCKTQAFDQDLLVCGSTNINWRSFTHDTELSCAIVNRKVVQNYYRQIWDYIFINKLLDDYVDFNDVSWAQQFFTAFDLNLISANIIEDPWESDEVILPNNEKRTNNIYYGHEGTGYQIEAGFILDPNSLGVSDNSFGRENTLKDIIDYIEEYPESEYRYKRYVVGKKP